MATTQKSLKTPLRYPGGKSRAMKFLGAHFPQHVDSYVEPFLGGGSVALWVTQQYPNANIHVNDAYHPLYAFWYQLQEQGTEMRERLLDIKRTTEHSEDAQRELFHDAQKWMHDDRMDMFTLACAFYIANKCSFSGIGTSDRQTKISGLIPIDRNSLTECCVGLVFNSPEDDRNGNSVKCTKIHELDFFS